MSRHRKQERQAKREWKARGSPVFMLPPLTYGELLAAHAKAEKKKRR